MLSTDCVPLTDVKVSVLVRKTVVYSRVVSNAVRVSAGSVCVSAASVRFW